MAGDEAEDNDYWWNQLEPNRYLPLLGTDRECRRDSVINLYDGQSLKAGYAQTQEHDRSPSN